MIIVLSGLEARSFADPSSANMQWTDADQQKTESPATEQRPEVMSRNLHLFRFQLFHFYPWSSAHLVHSTDDKLCAALENGEPLQFFVPPNLNQLSYDGSHIQLPTKNFDVVPAAGGQGSGPIIPAVARFLYEDDGGRWPLRHVITAGDLRSAGDYRATGLAWKSFYRELTGYPFPLLTSRSGLFRAAGIDLDNDGVLETIYFNSGALNIPGQTADDAEWTGRATMGSTVVLQSDFSGIDAPKTRTLLRGSAGIVPMNDRRALSSVADAEGKLPLMVTYDAPLTQYFVYHDGLTYVLFTFPKNQVPPVGKPPWPGHAVARLILISHRDTREVCTFE